VGGGTTSATGGCVSIGSGSSVGIGVTGALVGVAVVGASVVGLTVGGAVVGVIVGAAEKVGAPDGETVGA
jgi:hypothetical protein